MRSPLTQPSSTGAANPPTSTATYTQTAFTSTVTATGTTATATATDTAIPCPAGSHDCLGACVSNASVAGCGTSCQPCPTPASGKATCDGRSCGIACDPGYHDCAGACVSNTSVSSCGASCAPCPESPGNVATCDGSTCGLKCAVGCPDQPSESCIADQNLSALINEGARYVGQVYTAGRTGTLSGIAISVRSVSSSKLGLRVSMRDVADGWPGKTILGTLTLVASDSPLTNILRFSPPVEQLAGHQYAIVVDYPDAPPIGGGQMQGVWAGTTTDCYPGGYDVSSAEGTGWRTYGYDLFFEVFIKSN